MKQVGPKNREEPSQITLSARLGLGAQTRCEANDPMTFGQK